MTCSLAYAVCGVQRSGSSLLCKTLAATGLAGDPQEYYWNWRLSVDSGYSGETWVHWTETPWAREAAIEEWGRFAEELKERKSSSNGVFGVQIMGAYLDDLLWQLRTSTGNPESSDPALLEHWLPGCRYIRLTRRDKLRQAVSWAIADQTGVYNSTWPHPPKHEPRFDPWMVDDRHQRIVRSEARWDAFFRDHGVPPLTLVYEDFTRDFTRAVVATLDFLGIERPPDFTLAAPPLVKQGGPVNDEWVERYLAWRATPDGRNERGTPGG